MTKDPRPIPSRDCGEPRAPGRLLRFLIVGASGVAVNQGALVFLHGVWRWPLAPASAVAVEASILSNFVFNALWTWRDVFEGGIRRWLYRGLQYHAVTLAAAATNILGLVVLARGFGMDYRTANLVAIGIGSALTYLASDRWVFRRLR